MLYCPTKCKDSTNAGNVAFKDTTNASYFSPTLINKISQWYFLTKCYTFKFCSNVYSLDIVLLFNLLLDHLHALLSDRTGFLS